MKTIRQANEIAQAHVDGWVSERIWNVCEFIRDDQASHNVAGSIAEIGVHHGKLFFIIGHIGDGDTPLIAIDVFEDQEKNIDSSGGGSLKVFQQHIDTLFPELAHRVRVVPADSLSITGHKRLSLFPEPVRVFSVDGGHTVKHVINDLLIAQDVLAPRGTVMFDDFMHPHWPTVTEGFFQYMTSHNVRLAPYLIFQNKLFLTTFSEHQSVLDALHRYVDENFPDEFRANRWWYTSLCGHKVIGFL